MDENTDNTTTEQQPVARERIGQRAWVRSAALVGGGLIAGGILAGTLTATAADDGTTTDSSTVQEDGRGHHGGPGSGDPSQPQRDDEELLTGDTATQVTDAVLAEYPDATVERVETDSDGVYEAHIVTADDERLTVELDEDFAITGTEGD
jgi:predicted  nucleic acid-binding Zn-ribbon protein